MKIFFLLNPTKREKAWDYRDMAAKAAKQYGWIPRFGDVDRTQSRSTENHLRQAMEEGCSRIGVIGGDGTLNRVIQVLAQRKRLATMEIGVVPAGTCNDFARYLGLRKKRSAEALRALFTGNVRATDLGLMDSIYFLNNAGFGRRAATQQAGKSALKPLRSLRNFRPISVQASWDKGSIEGTFFMGLACNAPYFSGGLHFSKSTDPRDGWLDFFLVPRMPKWRLVSRLVLGKLGKPVGNRPMIALRAQALTITAETELWPQADGEPATHPVKSVQFSIAPEKAMIVCPDGTGSTRLP